MTRPTTDRAAMRAIIRALIADGWELDFVYDAEEEAPVSTEAEALDAIEAVDCAHLHFKRADGTGWVFFVLGNSPEEVACDYTLTLADVIDPLTEAWW